MAGTAQPRFGKGPESSDTCAVAGFTIREIYPPELGCANDERSGMHGTPIAGTTLLHLAIDFDEQEIFNLGSAYGMHLTLLRPRHS